MGLRRRRTTHHIQYLGCTEHDMDTNVDLGRAHYVLDTDFYLGADVDILRALIVLQLQLDLDIQLRFVHQHVVIALEQRDAVDDR